MTFKAGDKVKVIKHSKQGYFNHVVPIGVEVEIVEVLTFKKPNDRCRVNWEWKCGSQATVLPDDLEPIPASKVDTVGEEWGETFLLELGRAMAINDKVNVDRYARVIELVTPLLSTISDLRAEINELKKVK